MKKRPLPDSPQRQSYHRKYGLGGPAGTNLPPDEVDDLYSSVKRVNGSGSNHEQRSKRSGLAQPAIGSARPSAACATE